MKDDFTLKDLFSLIEPYINSSTSLNNEAVEDYKKIIETKINELYDEKSKLLENKDFNNNLKFLITYNMLIEILFLKLLEMNPYYFYYIIDEKIFKSFSKENSISNIVNKKPFESSLFELAFNLKILSKFNYDSIKRMKDIRNNFSFAHSFNENVEISYLNEYKIFAEKIKIIKIDFKLVDNNTKLFIEKINNGNYEEISELLLENLKLWKDKNEINDKLKYLLRKMLSFNNNEINIDYDLLDFFLPKIDDNISEKFLKYIKELFSSFYATKESENIVELLSLYNMLMSVPCYSDSDLLYHDIIYLLTEYIKIEGKYYNFALLNKLFEKEKIVNYIITKSANFKDGFSLTLYDWALTGNTAGIANNLIKFESEANKNPSLMIEISHLLFEPWCSNNRYEYRKEKMMFAIPFNKKTNKFENDTIIVSNKTGN